MKRFLICVIYGAILFVIISVFSALTVSLTQHTSEITLSKLWENGFLIAFGGLFGLILEAVRIPKLETLIHKFLSWFSPNNTSSD